MQRQPNGMIFISWLRTFVAAAALLFALSPLSRADTITTGVDTYVEYYAPDALNGTEIVLRWDGDVPPGAGAQPSQALLKFNLNLDGSTPNGTLRQRILATPYFRARIRIDVVDSGHDANLHRMIQAFDDNTTWNSLGGGVQTSGAGQNAETTYTASTSGAGSTGTIEIDVTNDLLAWANGATNNGWAFVPTGNDGVQIASFEGGAGAPVLILDQYQPLVASGPAGTTWKYFDQIPSGDPSYPVDGNGDPWYSADFDDGSWNGGAGHFGFGEGDEDVVLDNGHGGGNCSTKTPCGTTFLFRTTFQVTEIPDQLLAEIVRDDAIKLYLNGVEVLLDNLTEPVDAATFADLAITGNGEGVVNVYTLDPAALLLGTNILAVEVHNSSAQDSDLSFELALLAILDSLVLIPEPDTGTLLGLGLVALAAIRRVRLR